MPGKDSMIDDMIDMIRNGEPVGEWEFPGHGSYEHRPEKADDSRTGELVRAFRERFGPPERITTFLK